MFVSCERVRCKFCKNHTFYGRACFADAKIDIDKSGKCITFKKDTLENIKLMEAKKQKQSGV